MKNVSLIAMVFCLFVWTLKAEIITVQVTATVSVFDDYSSSGGYFGGGISVGNTLVMTYSYDTESLDSNSGNDYGLYYQAAPNMVNVEIGGYSIQSNLDSLDYVIGIGNQALGDSYYIRSSSNIILPNNVIIDSHIYWDINYDSEMFDNTNLLTTAPDISPVNYIQIGDGREFNILAIPTSIEIIPEPITLLTLGLGGFIIRIKRSKGGVW